MSVDKESIVLGKIVDSGADLGVSTSKDWHSEVYHPSESMDKYESAEWKAIEKIVKARDKHTCQSCGIKIGLTIHHILPREEQGTELPSNLITLCRYCHNDVEELGLRNKLQIIDLKRKRKYIKQDHTIATNDKPIRWQQWVYGGYRRPNS